jgi:hypothetical protein
MLEKPSLGAVVLPYQPRLSISPEIWGALWPRQGCRRHAHLAARAQYVRHRCQGSSHQVAARAMLVQQLVWQQW